MSLSMFMSRWNVFRIVKLDNINFLNLFYPYCNDQKYLQINARSFRGYRFITIWFCFKTDPNQFFKCLDDCDAYWISHSIVACLTKFFSFSHVCSDGLIVACLLKFSFLVLDWMTILQKKNSFDFIKKFCLRFTL